MIKRTRDEWHALFDEQVRSGLSAAAFCRQKRLCPKYFSLRRRQLAGERPEPSQAVFVSARVGSTGPAIEVQAGAVRLQVPVSVPARWLAELVQALG